MRNSAPAKSMDGIFAPASALRHGRLPGMETRQRTWRRVVATSASHLFWYLIGVAIIFLITFLKTHSATYFFQSPVVYVYTMFVTIFRISRIWGAMFYRYADKKIKEEATRVAYQPAITFVVPCKNEEGVIYRTVSKCFSSRYPKHKLEVIVVNDGSTDRTAEVLQRARRDFKQLVVVDWRVNRGKRHAMAEGFRRAKGDIVIQLDSDSYIDPEALPYLIDYFRNPSVGAVCAHAYIENGDENMLTKMQQAHYFVAFRISKAAESAFASVFCCSGCSSAYRKDVVLPILDQWLGETFLGAPVTWGDDRALTNWVLRSGYRTIYTDRARAYTVAPNNWRQFIKQQIRWKKGWFVNSIFAGKFILRAEPFVALTYFFPLTITTFLSPFVAAYVFLWDFLVNGIPPFFYIVGATLVSCVVIVYYRIIAPDNRYWPYLFLWTAVNMFFLSYILFYALATIQNRKWGTR